MQGIIFLCVVLQWIGVVSWLESSATALLTEVELAAGCFAGKRVQFVRSILNDLKSLNVGEGVRGPIIFLIDNSPVEPKRQGTSCAGNSIYDGWLLTSMPRSSGLPPKMKQEIFAPRCWMLRAT